MTGYAIREDGLGWRAIDSSDDVSDGEYFSTSAPPSPAHVISRRDIEEQRLRAYADPITGSDRYFAEASRMKAMGGSAADIDAATEAGIARAAEIAAMYPWPADPI